MPLGVAEAAGASLACALGSHGLDERDEIEGVRRGDPDGRQQMLQAARPHHVGWTIPEDFENPGLLGT
jgi:hypothetical protein